MTNKILLGIITAHHPSRQPYRDRARATFLRSSALDHVFVMGRPGRPDSAEESYHDTLYVDCPDEREWMVLKNQALFRYVLDQGYDYCFRCCDDTWVYPERLMNAGLEGFDYAGQMPCKLSLGGAFKVWMAHFDHMHGGCGIWLSRKAMEMLVADKWPGPERKGLPELVDVGMKLMVKPQPIEWDDLWIGEVLKGRLAIDDPLRQDSLRAYNQNGIEVYEDSLLFLNDNPSNYLSIHDPGVPKHEHGYFDDLRKQLAERGDSFVGVTS